ncbi:MAG: cytochrome c oxidase subunit 3 [Bryobacteraceae bacterium]|nr:cytochrome c oxidase subunit 3 [Bryobacteraceae bacterium]
MDDAIGKFRYWPNLPQFGMLAFLASLTMFFGSLILSYAFVLPANIGAQVRVPGTLWLSTLLIAASAGTLGGARWFIRRARVSEYRMLLGLTIALALGFLVSQFWACVLLEREGAFEALAGLQRGNVFYIFAGFHGLHLFGGIAALATLLLRVRRWSEETEQALRRQRNLDSLVAMYWNFVAVSWGVLFALLLYWTRG